MGAVGCEGETTTPPVEAVTTTAEPSEGATTAEPARDAWEYKCLETNREDVKLDFVGHIEGRFNDLGAQRWEMVGYAMNNGVNVRFVCFKRPITPP